MPNISAFLPNQTSNWGYIPGDLHTEGGAQKSKAEGPNSTPTEGQQVRLVPSIEVVSTPAATTKDEMFLSNDNDMNHSPIPNDAQERLKGIMEIFSSEASDEDRDNETEGYKDDSRNAKCPRTEVLGMQCE